MFTVTLHTDPILAGDKKYRNAYSRPAIYTYTAVNIGNFSSLDIYNDNSVELSVPYNNATACNVIKITSGTIIIVGLISNYIYINDSNTRIVYNVDPWTSARTMNNIAPEGLCERVNMTYKSVSPAMGGMLTNLQGNPFSPSDTTVAHTTLTAALNNAVLAFEGVPVNSMGIYDYAYVYILTVSQAVIEYLMYVSQPNNIMSTPSSYFSQELINIATLSFFSNDNTIHSGGLYRGTPLKFNTYDECSDFIQQILGGCGFITILPPEGYSEQQANYNRQYQTTLSSGAGQSNITYTDADNIENPIEAVRFITAADIYNLYIIPDSFAINQGGNFTNVTSVSAGISISTLHRWGAENVSKSPLFAHPYYYINVVTANGDSVNIIPQTHFNGIINTAAEITLKMRYIGGDTPRLMGRFFARGNDMYPSGDSPDSVMEWFTIRAYPSLTLSIDNNYNIQVQNSIANLRQVTAAFNNARTANQLSNPMGQAYHDRRGGMETDNPNRNWLGNIAAGIGAFFSGGENYQAQASANAIQAGNLNAAGLGQANNGTMFSDPANQAAQSTRESIQAGNIISAPPSSIMGNDNISQLSISPFSAYRRGASDIEMYSYCRYIEQFGATANFYLNIVDNSNMGGISAEIDIAPFNGRTFYKYVNVHIQSSIPEFWKQQITALLQRGVYIYDN